jgi:23S rRNA (adenine2030-N6)-methyltransferase
MNYRHAFHAGNFADVFKHVILTRILAYLMLKDAPLRYIDTHAGIGRYDLSSEEAQRGGEWRLGVGRLPAAPFSPAARELLAPYLALLPAAGEAPGAYVGSPLIAQALLRPQDRLVLCELHPHDVRRLGRALGRDDRCKLMHMDGYQALKACLPPPERRGLVLIDPPFEAKDEFERLGDAIEAAWSKWPTGCFAIWYPLKATPEVDRFRHRMGAGKIRRVLCLEHNVDHPGESGPLKGSGLVIINPPFVLEQEARVLLPELARALAQGPGAGARISWLAGE